MCGSDYVGYKLTDDVIYFGMKVKVLER